MPTRFDAITWALMMAGTAIVGSLILIPTLEAWPNPAMVPTVIQPWVGPVKTLALPLALAAGVALAVDR